MSTSERERLLDLYTRAAAALSESVAELERAGLNPGSHRFEAAWSACQESDRRCTEIQQRIYEYLRDHCGSENTTTRQPSEN